VGRAQSDCAEAKVDQIPMWLAAAVAAAGMTAYAEEGAAAEPVPHGGRVTDTGDRKLGGQATLAFVPHKLTTFL